MPPARSKTTDTLPGFLSEFAGVRRAASKRKRAVRECTHASST